MTTPPTHQTSAVTIAVVAALVGFGSAVYSVVVLEYYTILISRSNSIGRALLFILVLPILFAPLLAMHYLDKVLDQDTVMPGWQDDAATRINLFVWLGVLWLFLIVRWRTIQDRLRA